MAFTYHEGHPLTHNRDTATELAKVLDLVLDLQLLEENESGRIGTLADYIAARIRGLGFEASREITLTPRQVSPVASTRSGDALSFDDILGGLSK